MAAETKTPKVAGKEPTHWVVLHNMVGRFEKGKIVARIEWPEGTSFPDLQRLGAIRPADPSEVEEGFAELDPDASKNARLKEVEVLQTQINLLEKELAYYKDESHKIKLQNPAGNNVEPSEGVKTLIKKKDAAIKELTERLESTEAERKKFASEVDQLRQALEEATKPSSTPASQPEVKK